MGFVQDVIKENEIIWEECLNTDFLKKLADGTLDEECFKGYIIDDSLYLREYAKVFAYGMVNAKDMEDIRNYYSFLSFVNESEGATRVYYINKYGINDRDVWEMSMRKENADYTQYMLAVAKNALSPAKVMMATLPCMLSYAWIFKKILKENKGILDTPYGRFVSDYADGEYDKLCDKWVEYAKEKCKDLSEEEKAECRKIFTDCSKFELGFWKMSERKRED